MVQNFVKQIKATYLSGKNLVELPQQNRSRGDFDPDLFLQQAAEVLGCDLDSLKHCRRVSPEDRDKRDMMIYCLWQTGMLTNEKIGGLFGLTYSSVSRQVRDFEKRYKENNTLKLKYKNLKSQIKMTPIPGPT
jgi:hypothetical protein